MTLAAISPNPLRMTAEDLDALVAAPLAGRIADHIEFALLLTPGGVLPDLDVDPPATARLAMSTPAAARRAIRLGGRALDLDLLIRREGGRRRFDVAYLQIPTLSVGMIEFAGEVASALDRRAPGRVVGAATARAIWRAAVLAHSQVRSSDGSLIIRFPTAPRARLAAAAANALGLLAIIEPTSRAELQHRVRIPAGDAPDLLSMLGPDPVLDHSASAPS